MTSPLTEPSDTPAQPSPGAGRRRVVVGLDGSPSSREALVAALLAAARRDADLDVITCFSVELFYLGSSAPLDVPDVEHVRADTEARARAVIADVLDEVPVSAVPGVKDVGVSLLMAAGGPAHVLVDASRNADLLVVGSRGRGAAQSGLLGSVALHSVTHAACPVLVAHPGLANSPSPQVVVGVDGSAGSRAALVSALEEATRLGATLEVVVTYAVEDYWTDLGTVLVPSVEEIHRRLRERTDGLVEEVLGERAARGDEDGAEVPEVVVAVVEGAAGEVLVHRARAADLLVVGSRGHGTLRGLLLGSVALHCAMHATCPVLVVHPEPARSSGRSASATTGVTAG